MPNNDKLFGRFHDVVILLLGFLLTTGAGGSITACYQTRADQIQREAETRRDTLLAATNLFEELSQSMDRRLYRMRRLHLGLANRVEEAELESRWDLYREALFEWNENLNRNLALTQHYFGEDARETLEKKIQAQFRQVGRLLEQDKGGRQEALNKLNQIIYDFDVLLISRIPSVSLGETAYGVD